MRRTIPTAASLVLGAAVLASGTTLAMETPTPPGAPTVGEAWALVQEHRESGQVELLDRAEAGFEVALAADPTEADALVGLGSIVLSRHDFEAALEHGRAARVLAPQSARPLGVEFDALIELGRYDEAGAVIELMVRMRPDLASLSRLSYYHELHGRLDDAIEAMEQAVIAGGPSAENTEFTRTLLGDLWLLKGDPGRARHLYETAVTRLPGYMPAELGLARIAEAEGDLAEAERRYREAITVQPEPATMLALGELLAGLGRTDEAATMLREARAGEAAHRATGEPPEPFGVIMEVDHGDRALALELAQQAYRHAPSIQAADALAWALFHDGQFDEARRFAAEATRTGTLDPGIRSRARVIAGASAS